MCHHETPTLGQVGIEGRLVLLSESELALIQPRDEIIRISLPYHSNVVDADTVLCN